MAIFFLAARRWQKKGFRQVFKGRETWNIYIPVASNGVSTVKHFCTFAVDLFNELKPRAKGWFIGSRLEPNSPNEQYLCLFRAIHQNYS